MPSINLLNLIVLLVATGISLITAIVAIVTAIYNAKALERVMETKVGIMKEEIDRLREIVRELERERDGRCSKG